MEGMIVTRKFYFLGIFLILISAALVFPGCSKESASDDLVVGPRKGNQAPNFTLSRIEGGQLELESLRGKAVLIDFWDTWCGPCRHALPHLQAIS